MGRLLLLLLIIAAVVLLWMAFKPSTWKGSQQRRGGSTPAREIKGPDDDEEFLWNIEKNRFKQRRAQEAAIHEEEERLKRARERYAQPTDGEDTPDTKDQSGGIDSEGFDTPSEGDDNS